MSEELIRFGDDVAWYNGKLYFSDQVSEKLKNQIACLLGDE